jgi:GT2 family glycosyltransferase
MPDHDAGRLGDTLARAFETFANPVVLVWPAGRFGASAVLEECLMFCRGGDHRLALIREANPFLGASQLATICGTCDSRVADAIDRIALGFDGNFQFLALVQSVTESAAKIAALEKQLAEAKTAFQPATPLADASPALAATGGSLDYATLLRRVRRSVEAATPPICTLAVLSKGDDELLKFGGRTAWHFPRTSGGTYAGSHPAGSTAAIAHLEALRAAGADYLVIPETALWWLDHYREFSAHLGRYREVVREAGVCRIFCLGESTGPAGVERMRGPLTFSDVLDRCRDGHNGQTAVLDWDTGLDLRACLDRAAVFSPPEPGHTLPYLDRSIDIVAVPANPALAGEARRVARTAVITLTNGGPDIQVDWLTDGPAAVASSATLILPCPETLPRAGRFWETLFRSLPEDFAGEIVTDAAGVGPRSRYVSRDNGEGYAAYCDRMTEAVAGDVLIFLAPPLVPLDNWLPALCDTLRRDPAIGAAGPKVLAAEGSLAGAGGVVFADGTTAGFGSGEYDSDDPLYSFARTADFTGDVALATLRSVWDRLGGFDRKFQSPTYAHADYCFRLRDLGLVACCAPDSILVAALLHPCSATARQDTADRDRFRAKWGAALARQPSPRHWRDRDTWHALAAAGRGGADV